MVRRGIAGWKHRLGRCWPWCELKEGRDGRARKREWARQGEGMVDVAWGSFSRSRLPSPGTRSARIFLLASAEDQTSHFISDDPFNPYPSRSPPPPSHPPVTLVLPLFDPRSILLQPPLRPGFYPNVIPLPFSRHPELWLITYRRSL